MSQEDNKDAGLKFGPWKLDRREVFLESKLCLAIVNFKPIVPGHVLALPRRVVPRFSELTQEETCDLILMSQRVAAAIEKHYGATACTLTVQDGPDAGQTVPHVHVHIMPRVKGDFEPNDKIYTEIEENERSMKKQRMDAEEERKPRTVEEMAEEANTLKKLFEN